MAAGYVHPRSGEIDRPEAETQGTRAPLAPHEDAPGLRRYTLYALFVVLVLDVLSVQHC